jgi:hypothetical protein
MSNQKAFKQLCALSKKALSSNHSERLLWTVLEKNKFKIDFNSFFLPEELSIGYNTEYYKSFNEEQKVFLNQLSYYITYFRIGGAEQIAVVNNTLLSKYITDDHLKRYLLLESAEEVDHIKTFKKILDSFQSHYGIAHLKPKNKITNKISNSNKVMDLFIRSFGIEYGITYFVSRGIFNHMGSTFENEVLKESKKSSVIHEISKLHVIDEARHTGTSSLFSEVLDMCSSRAFQQPKSHIRKIYPFLEENILKSSFDEKMAKNIERNIAIKFMNGIKLFDNLDRNEINQICKSHFNSLTELERFKNMEVPQKNLKVINKSLLNENSKESWKAQLGSLSGFGKLV